MTLTEPFAVTAGVVEVLDRLGVPYFLGGSFASSAQGAARATLDADIAGHRTYPGPRTPCNLRLPSIV